MSIVRKRSAAQKAYIPTSARDNQYILAEFSLTDELVTQFEQLNDSTRMYEKLYQSLSQALFTLSHDYQVGSTVFVANDKLVRVRYSQDMHQWQTSQQILFYYNPQEHHLRNAFYDVTKRANKITLVFLANGDDIRKNAAHFHKRVIKLLSDYSMQFKLDANSIRVRDHQHLTYDLFAKHKGCLSKDARKLRHISDRYRQHQFEFPLLSSSITYAVVNLAITEQILNLVDIDLNSTDPYNPLYTFLTDTFSLVAKRFNLNNGALIANGLVPIVRHSVEEQISRAGELQMLGYNPEQSPCGIISKWRSDQLVDNVHLIFVATKESFDAYGFGRFLNQIEQAIKLMATELEIDPSQNELTVRFHQHVGYDF